MNFLQPPLSPPFLKCRNSFLKSWTWSLWLVITSTSICIVQLHIIPLSDNERLLKEKKRDLKTNLCTKLRWIMRSESKEQILQCAALAAQRCISFCQSPRLLNAIVEWAKRISNLINSNKTNKDIFQNSQAPHKWLHLSISKMHAR